MYVCGMTLGVQGMAMHASEPSLLISEIQSTSIGIMRHLAEFTNAGVPVISDIGWIEGKLILSLLRRDVDLESQKNNWLAAHAEPYARSVADALGWEL